MTPRTLRNGWWAPPIDTSSSRVAIIVCGDDGSTKHCVSDEPVNVDRDPRRVGDRVPHRDARRQSFRRYALRWRHHICQPTVSDEHHRRAPDVEQYAEAPMEPLCAAAL